MNVTLPWAECMIAAQCGVMRRIFHLKHDTSAMFNGGPSDPWEADIEGAAAELAVAKVLGTYWTGLEVAGSDRKAGIPDAGGVQVRSTRHRGGSLILHETDADDALFVLVVGRMPTYEIKGWIHGRDGKRADYWRSESVRHPAYFVPANALSAITSLGSRRAASVGT